MKPCLMIRDMICWMMFDDESQLLEADDVDGLHIVFPGGNLVEDVVSVDLGILNHAADLQLVDLTHNVNLLVVGAPHETVQNNFLLDLCPKTVQVESLLVDLYVEDHDGLGNDSLLLLLGSRCGLRLWLFNGLIIAEEVDVILILFGLLFLLLLFLFLFLLLLLFLLFLLLLLLGPEGLVGLLGEVLSADDGVGLDEGEVPGSGVGIGLAFLFSEDREDDSDAGGKTVVSEGGRVSNQELSSSEVLLNEGQELSDISKDLDGIHFSSVSGDGHGGNCGFEIAGGDVQPLVDEGPVVQVVAAVEGVAVGGGQEPDDGVG